MSLQLHEQHLKDLRGNPQKITTHAKWWKKFAAKAEAPMIEEEIVCTFIKTHDPLYFEEIFRMTRSLFATIVNKLE